MERNMTSVKGGVTRGVNWTTCPPASRICSALMPPPPGTYPCVNPCPDGPAEEEEEEEGGAFGDSSDDDDVFFAAALVVTARSRRLRCFVVVRREAMGARATEGHDARRDAPQVDMVVVMLDVWARSI